VADPDVAQFAAGWHICLDRMELRLAGADVRAIRGAEAREHGWEELRDAYAGRLSTAS